MLLVSTTHTLAGQCPGVRPCFDYTFSLDLLGPIERIFPKNRGEEIPFLKQYAAGGYGPWQVIELGRDAARFFKERFGVDFTGLSADKYLLGGSVIDGVASFRPFVADRKANYRLTSATHKDRAQFFNKRVDYAGWLLKFEKDFVSQGTFKGTVPKDGISVVGSYVIRPCERERHGTCTNILRPGNPAEPIFIAFTVRGFLGPPEPEVSAILNLSLESSEFGKGSGVGVLRPKKDGTVELANTLFFPNNFFSK